MLTENQSITLEKDSYTLVKLIGEGGQGVIWQVTATSTGKSCVLKTIRTHEVSALGRVQPFDTQVLNALSGRMQEEIDFLRVVEANKKNCFIARCLDHGVIHSDDIDLPAMIMPHYPKDLQWQIPRSIEQRPEYDLSLLLNWLTQLSQALQCTHEQLIDGHAYMHRDIKPPNILLTANNEVRLIDFGIAKQQSDDTGTTSIAHSPAWAAPEQALPEYVRDNGDNVFRLTEKTDLYSLGLVAYYLCTGGAKPKTQEDFSRRSQSIYAQHLMALSDGKSGQLGKIGGLSEEDSAYLQRRLLTFFFAQHEDDTIPMQAVNRLPLPHIISEQIVALIRQLLLPLAVERPSAEEAKQQFQHLQQCLSPRLHYFAVNVYSDELLVGEALELKLQLNGQGLTRPFDWLRIYDQHQQLLSFEVLSVTTLTEETVFLLKENWVQLRLAGFETEGEYHLSIAANVGDKTHTVETTCYVTSSASQLWAQGQHEAALRKNLRDEWLNSLEKKALGSVKARYDYLQLLETLQQVVTNDKQKVRLEARYQRAEMINNKMPFWQKSVMMVVGLGLLGSLLFKIMEDAKEPIQQAIVINKNDIEVAEPPAQQAVSASDSNAMPQALIEKPQRQSFEPEMISIPAGSFKMGCVTGKECRDNEKPVHKVTLTAFKLAKTEVTFAQWDACVTAKGCSYEPNDEGWGRGQRPVINISWNRIQEYVQWLNKETGKAYRLPTEAEWEYAARAGTSTQYSWGNEKPSCDKKAKNGASHNGGKGSDCYYKLNDQYRGTEVVASYAANPWGLYDMHGNVWEWTCSIYEGEYKGAESRCAKVTDDTNRVLRGGGWYYHDRYMRSAMRFNDSPNIRYNNFGLRLALDQPSSSQLSKPE